MNHTLESCLASAAKYTRRTDWRAAESGPYQAARLHGWFDQCSAHMAKNKSWTLETCMAVAAKYSTRNAWKRCGCSSYASARYNGWIEECCTHMIAQKETWTIEKCKAIAAKYEVMQHWKINDRNSYFTAYRNDWLDECCAHMDKFAPMTFDECKAAALKFTTRSKWKDGDVTTYRAAERNGWSELCTEHMGLPCTVSGVETDVFEYILSICPDAIRGDRTLLGGKLEIDIYVPSLKIGFEYNGLEWHCDKRGRGLDYHQEKTNIAASRGIRLIHIWSDEWLNSEMVVKGFIRRVLGAKVRRIQARQCDVVATTLVEQREFLDANHLQGAGGGGSGYALVFEGEVVAAAIVRKNRNSEMELVRWCVKMDTDVIGGFSKLVSRFEPGLISFCDTTKFDGTGYVGAGWVMIGHSPAITFYTDKNSSYRISADKMRKPDLITRLLGAGFQQSDLDGKTQVELAKMLGYNRVQGCALLKFKYLPI